ARLAEAAGILARRRGAMGQVLELADVVLGETVAAATGVDREVPEPAPVLVERHGEPAGYEARRVLLVLAVAVRDLDRAGPRAVGRPRDRLGAVGRQAVRRDGRRALRALEPDQ